MIGSSIGDRERTLFGGREGNDVTVFEASLTFFVLALATIAANAWDVRWLSFAGTRWFSTVCIVLGIASLLV